MYGVDVQGRQVLARIHAWPKVVEYWDGDQRAFGTSHVGLAVVTDMSTFTDHVVPIETPPVPGPYQFITGLDVFGIELRNGPLEGADRFIDAAIRKLVKRD